MPLASRLRAGVAASAALGLLLAAPAPADAATHHQTARTFVAHGMVVSRSASTVTVLATDLRTGRTVLHNRRVVVTLPSRRTTSGKALARSMRSLTRGDRVTVSGSVAGTGRRAAFHASGLSHQVAPFHVYLGTVTALNGTLVTVHKGAEPSDDANEDNHGSFTVDVSTATVSVDAAAGSLAIGHHVAVLGSSVNDIVVATSVFAFTTSPDVVSGDVSSVTGTVVTVASQDEQDSHDGAQGAPTVVDLAGAALIIDGTSNSTPDQITVGARISMLGMTDSAGTFVPSVAFAFGHKCDSHHHGDGGADEQRPDGGSSDDGGSGGGDNG
jgi:hypothetical protein